VSDVEDARRVAQQLGIDHLVFNFTEDFGAHVVGPYVAAHVGGRTPNPCVECNRHLKFDRLTRRADLLGFDAVATGHHARVVRDDERWRLARGVDRAKDQSYVLHMLGESQLARVRFPVGSMSKSQVRARAAALGLRTAAKPDSQDVCFITSRQGRAGFIGGRVELTPAPVVDTTGRPVGHVDAVELVTVGQRRGLGGRGGSEPRFVVDVDVTRPVVTVGSAADLLTERLVVDDLRWAGRAASEATTVLVQCSAHGQPRAAEVGPDGIFYWHERQRRVAPGQSVVLYDVTDTFVLAGGTAA
jgi:tRNA-specific 2-thiouridylase